MSILDIIYDSDLVGMLFADGSVIPGGTGTRGHDDVTHINDIETLDRADASAFPRFEAGDIMVSMRILNAVVVIDRKTRRIKWSRIGPYIRQHDPDFLPNGRISVFDNRTDNADGTLLGGSRIIEVDIDSPEPVVVYDGATPDGPRFYTEVRGKHQYLPNGNILLTEEGAGRALEVTPDGTTVWAYIDRWDEERIVRLTEATRYPESYADFTRNSAACEK